MEKLKFGVLDVQAVIFPNTVNFDANKILKQILVSSDKFDGKPVVLPLPLNAPPEVPHIIVDGTAGYRVTVSRNRVDVYWHPEDVGSEADFSHFFNWVPTFFSDFIKATNATIGRLAGIIRRHTPMENPAIYLSRHFCAENWWSSPFDRPADFEIHSRKIYNHSDIEVNSWVRCRTSTVIVLPPGRANLNLVGLSVEQDINTLEENKRRSDFKFKSMEQFYSQLPAQFDRTLDLYFPGKE